MTQPLGHLGTDCPIQTEAWYVKPRQETEHPMPGDGRPLIVHVTQSLGWGGLERVVYDLAREVDPARYRAAVISLSDDLGRGAQFAAGGIPTAVVTQRGLDPALPYRLAQRFRDLGAALVLAHNFGRFFYAGPAARLAKVPALYTEHSNTRPEERALWLTQRRLSRLATGIVAVSDTVRDYLVTRQRLPADRVQVIPNGIDLAPFEDLPSPAAARRAIGLPEAAQVIGHVGRLAPVKNQKLLLEAFGLLADDLPASHLVLAGDGELRGELAADAARRGLAARVHFLGRRDDVPAVLAAMDVFCLCSHSEGLPLAIVEAMAAGLPVVATSSAGRDLVAEGQTGYLTPPGEPGPLAARLRQLLGDATERHDLAAQARQVAWTRYGVGVMAAAYAAVFDRVLSAG